MRHVPNSIYDKHYIVTASLPVTNRTIYGAGTNENGEPCFSFSVTEAKYMDYYDAYNEAFYHSNSTNVFVHDVSMKIDEVNFVATKVIFD